MSANVCILAGATKPGGVGSSRGERERAEERGAQSQGKDGHESQGNARRYRLAQALEGTEAMASAAAGEALPSGLGEVAPRSRLYQVLQAPYRYPGEDLHAELAAGRWLAQLEAASEALPFAVPSPAGLREPPAKLEDAQVEYSPLFH